MSKKIISILIIALAAGLGFAVSLKLFQPFNPKSLSVVTLIETPRKLPAFSLQSTKGEITAEQLKGSWTVIFLGFTHCPDICPTTLSDMAVAQKIWSESGAENIPKLLFVSIDPERDTPKILAEYSQFFNSSTLTATTHEPQLSEFVHSLGLVYAKVPQGESYTMDHSATMVVLNSKAEFAGLIRAPFKPKELAAEMQILMKNSQ